MNVPKRATPRFAGHLAAGHHTLHLNDAAHIRAHRADFERILPG